MRCDQHAGLPLEAQDFLLQQEIEPKVCSECKRPYPVRLASCGKYYGMFNQEYDLFRHQLKDGRYADEYLQANPWSSGPVFFIGLRVYDTEENITDDFQWSEEEIDNA